MEDFKLEFYFNLYKDKPISTRGEFRIKFKKKHGEYEDVDMLLTKIETYQIEKYGTTLYNWDKNIEKQEAYFIEKNKEIEMLKKRR